MKKAIGYATIDFWGHGGEVYTDGEGEFDTRITGYHVDSACKIEQTGKVAKWSNGIASYRSRITILGDGEPDTILKGWFAQF